MVLIVKLRLFLQPGSVMPFYGSNIPAGNVTEATPGFPQAVREHRFPNTVWQQASVPADAAAMSKYWYSLQKSSS